MPYSKIDELPEEVKALGADKAQQWLNVFNSVFKKTNDEKEAAKQAWGVVKKDADEKFSIDMEIFSEGTWNGEKFTTNDLDNITAAFNELKKEFLPRIKLGHAESQVDVALGTINNIWRSGKKLMASIIDMPRIVYDAVKNKLFQGVSVELMVDYKSLNGNKYPLALSAAALLGGELPAVKDLAGLTAYMKQTGTFLLKRAYSNKKGEEKMVDITQAEYDELKKNAANAKTLADKIIEMEKDIKAEQQAALQKKFTSAVKEFKEFCNKMVEDKKLMPANRDLFFGQVDKKSFKDESSIEEIETLKVFVENQIKTFDAKSNASNENPKDFEDPAEELHFKTTEYLVNHPDVEYEQAQKLILMKDAKLAKKYADRPYTLPAK